MTPNEFLSHHPLACPSLRAWMGSKSSMKVVWDHCARADWMMVILCHVLTSVPNKGQLWVQLEIAIARRCLEIVEDARAGQALDLLEEIVAGAPLRKYVEARLLIQAVLSRKIEDGHLQFDGARAIETTINNAIQPRPFTLSNAAVLATMASHKVSARAADDIRAIVCWEMVEEMLELSSPAVKV